MAAALSACGAIDTGGGTAAPTGASGYLSAVDDASAPVVELEAQVKTGIDGLVESIGDGAISGSASGTVISLNRRARELADEAEQAAFALSRLSVPGRCQKFHERQSDALRQIAQEGFEYANGTDIEGMSAPRLDLEAIARGDTARAEAMEALSEGSALREACEG